MLEDGSNQVAGVPQTSLKEMAFCLGKDCP